MVGMAIIRKDLRNKGGAIYVEENSIFFSIGMRR